MTARAAWRRFAPHLALAPMLGVALVAYLGSTLWTLAVSFTPSRSFPVAGFAGLAAYERLFSNARWLLSLENLALYGLLFVAAALVLGVALALAVDRVARGASALRTIFLYPYAMSFIATGLVWQWLLNPGIGIQEAVRQWGVAGFVFDWIVDPDRVVYTLVLATAWQAAGLVMVIALAGLRNVDPEIRKAARLDGIPAWRTTVSIVLPMIGPALATALLLLLASTVKLYDAVVAMTQGGPGTASEVPAKFIMDHLFGRANIALASAGSIVLLLTVAALLAPVMIARAHGRSRLGGR